MVLNDGCLLAFHADCAASLDYKIFHVSEAGPLTQSTPTKKGLFIPPYCVPYFHDWTQLAC